MKQPYIEKLINENIRLRKFSSNTPEDQLVWHRDRQDRVVEVIGGKGWMFQRDGSIPVQISPGTIFEVSANEWHRIIKGDGDLIVKITEEKNKKLSKKQKRIAQAAPPPDEITGADFKALRNKKKDEGSDDPIDDNKDLDIFESLFLIHEKKKRKKKKKKASDRPHPKQYGAPQGSRRDKELDATKKDLASNDPKRKARAYRRRERMEKRDRKDESLNVLSREEIIEIIQEVIAEAELDKMLSEIDERLDEKLSAKTKATLKKKAEKRGLTPGSVYREFKKGLAAWATSGSRKGMSQHQWAHARVNSATPSKSWAVVKKRKKSE